MLYTLARATLIASAAGLIVSPAVTMPPSAAPSAAAAVAAPLPAPLARARLCVMQEAEGGDAAADFTEDLLEALTTDDEPLAPVDEPMFVTQGASGVTLETLPSYVNAGAVEELRNKYKLHEKDTGSTQVQVAVLTARIAYMTKHMQENKKDYASLRGLTAMVNRRKKLLEYLLQEDFPEFKRITAELGIRTNQLLKPKLSGARGRRV